MKIGLQSSVPLLLLLVAGQESLRGHGIPILDQDAEASARGNAFTANNPSILFYNLAGITQLPGQQFRVGTYALTYQTSYRSPADVEADLWYDYC